MLVCNYALHTPARRQPKSNDFVVSSSMENKVCNKVVPYQFKVRSLKEGRGRARRAAAVAETHHRLCHHSSDNHMYNTEYRRNIGESGGIAMAQVRFICIQTITVHLGIPDNKWE